MHRLIFAFILMSIIPAFTGAQQLSKSNNDSYDFTRENRITMHFSNNGSLGHNPMTDGSGVEWPRGGGKFVVFQEGLLFGGRVNGEVRVGGSTYRQGLQAGIILPDGTEDNANSPLHRVFQAHRFDAAWWNALGEAEKVRLRADLVEWPAQFGAPWIDANGNGVYDPDVTVWEQGGVTDTPLLPGDEVFWYVSNDLDGSRTSNLYGTAPMGLEVQTMIWSSAGHPLLDNVVFRMHTLINKGPETITDMKLGAWEDPDLGDATDDFIGVDTALGLMYSYNGSYLDEVYGIPPASGTLWLQTPVAPGSGVTAQFGFGTRPDHINLPLSGFTHYINADPVYQDPDLGTAEGAVQMINNLQGGLYNGSPMIDPTTGNQIRFSLSGDPLFGEGWIDGIIHPPGDRRKLSVCGSFDLAPGDTQKVLFARIVAEADNQLLAVRALRKASRQLQDLYRNLPVGAVAPVLSSSVSHPSGGNVGIFVSGGPFAPGTTSVEAVLYSHPDHVEVARVSLTDDGTGGDVTAGDGVFGGDFTVLEHAAGADLFIETTDGGIVRSWFVESEVALPGPARVRLADVASDSRNFDGAVNPGENVRLRIRIENGCGVAQGPWRLFLLDEANRLAGRAVQRRPAVIDAGASHTPVYAGGDPDTYLSVTIPEGMAPGPLRLPVVLMSAQHCVWRDTLVIDVVEPDEPPVEGLFAHVQGNAFGSLGYVVVDRAALTDHAYRVTVEGADHETKTLRVEDVTLGSTLYTGLPVPDRWAHDSQVIDGWRIRLGTAIDSIAYNAQGERVLGFSGRPSGTFSEPTRAWMDFYSGYLISGEDFFGSAIRMYDLVPVRLVFDRVSGQKGIAWLRGGSPNYAYQGYFDIPLRAYDISDPGQPRQLMVGFVEQRGSAGHDNTWMPTTSPGDREYFFIFNDDYDTSVDPKFQGSILAASEGLDVLWAIWPLRDTTRAMFEDGDTFTIEPRIPISNRDVYITPPDILMDAHATPARPATVTLHAPYPNPARGQCVITFDTRAAGTVSLTVHDLLGRHVATLVDRALDAGTHHATLNALSLRTGTYRVVLESSGQRATRTLTVLR